MGGLTLVLGIDPGAKPGYAIVDSDSLVLRTGVTKPLPLVLEASTKPLTRPVDVAVTEGQWYKPVRRKRQRDGSIKVEAIDQTSIYKVSFSAGWRLARAPAREFHRIEVRDWKNAVPFVRRRGQAITKEVFCNLIERALTPEEKAMLPDAAGKRKDVLDAIGIAWAFCLGAKTYQVPTNS